MTGPLILGAAVVAEDLLFTDPRVGGVVNDGTDQSSAITAFVNMINGASNGSGKFPPGVVHFTPPAVPWTLGGAGATTSARMSGAGGGGSPGGGASQLVALSDSGSAMFTNPVFVVGGGSGGDWALEKLSIACHQRFAPQAGVLPSATAGVQIEGNGKVIDVDVSNASAALIIAGDHLLAERVSGSGNGCGILFPPGVSTQGDVLIDVSQLSGKTASILIANSSYLGGVNLRRETAAGEPFGILRYNDGSGPNSQDAIDGCIFLSSGFESLWHGYYFDELHGSSKAGNVQNNTWNPAGGSSIAYTNTTTSAQLTTGGPITSIPLNAPQYAIQPGILWVVSPSGVRQSFQTAGCAAGASSVPVTSKTPSYTFPAGSQIVSIDANTWAAQVTGATVSGGQLTVTVPAGFWIRPGAMQVVDPSGAIAPGTVVTSIASGSWPGTTYTLNLSTAPSGNPTGLIALIMPRVAALCGGIFSANKYSGGVLQGGDFAMPVHLVNWFNTTTSESDVSAVVSAVQGGQPYVQLEAALYGSKHAWGNQLGSPKGTMGPTMVVGEAAAAIAQYDALEYAPASGHCSVQPATGANKFAGVALRAVSSGAIEYLSTTDSVTVSNKSGTAIAANALIKPDASNPGGVTTASALTDGPAIGRVTQAGGVAAGAQGTAYVWG